MATNPVNMLYGKRDFKSVMKVNILEMGRLSWIVKMGPI